MVTEARKSRNLLALDTKVRKVPQFTVRVRVAVLVVLMFALIMVDSSQAIDIVLQFDDVQSEAPTFDPDGTSLQSMFAFAESFYEDVFEDEETLNSFCVCVVCFRFAVSFCVFILRFRFAF